MADSGSDEIKYDAQYVYDRTQSFIEEKNPTPEMVADMIKIYEKARESGVEQQKINDCIADVWNLSYNDIRRLSYEQVIAIFKKFGTVNEDNLWVYRTPFLIEHLQIICDDGDEPFYAVYDENLNIVQRNYLKIGRAHV